MIQIRRLLIPVFLLGGSAGAAAPPGYYDLADGKIGGALKSALHEVLDNHKVIPYTRSDNADWHDGKDLDVWFSRTQPATTTIPSAAGFSSCISTRLVHSPKRIVERERTIAGSVNMSGRSLADSLKKARQATPTCIT